MSGHLSCRDWRPLPQHQHDEHARVRDGRSEEAKVACVNDCRCIRFPCEVIECRKAATDVCNAEDSALRGIEDFCLGIYLVLRLGVWGSRGTGGRRGRARKGLHFEEEGGEGDEYDGGEDAEAELAERTTSTQGSV